MRRAKLHSTDRGVAVLLAVGLRCCIRRPLAFAVLLLFLTLPPLLPVIRPATTLFRSRPLIFLVPVAP